MRRIGSLVLLLFIGFSACKKSPEYFIGKWQIWNVIDNNKSVDLIDNWMHLKSNGTFESYDGTLKKSENGRWTYNLKEKTLFVDGAGEGSDSEWILSTANDTLFFHSTSGNLYLIATKIND